MSILRFHWIRHAPPINPGNICYGVDMKVDLSDTEAFRRQLARLPENAQWSASPLPRTMETAQTLLAHQNKQIPIKQRPDLREQFFGAWVDRPRTELAQDPAYPLYVRDPQFNAPPGGECLQEFSERVHKEIEKVIVENPNGGDVVLVAHAGTIRAALAFAVGRPMSEMLRYAISPLSLSVIEYDHKKKARGRDPWTLESLNIKP